ncbi:MAG: 3'-5' exonuclease [Flavobacteriales bacterium]|nr:3'-5' exonuclease [Flavobacteriales bacterium]
MKLNLKRPLVFFDLETTGTSIAQDRIVEIALVKVMPDGSVHTKPSSTGADNRFLINPEMPIPLESSLIHGIYDEHVAEAPTFKDIADKLFIFLSDCDLGGFNSNRFDIPLLAEEFLRVGIDFSIEDRNLVDAQVIFHMMEQRTLKAGYKFYCGKSLDDAHEALPDAMATYEIFVEQMERYQGQEAKDTQGNPLPTLTNDMEVVNKFCQRNRHADLMGRFVYNADDVVVFNFGKYKGQSVKGVLESDPGYYGWMMKGDFPLYTKKVLKSLRAELNRP